MCFLFFGHNGPSLQLAGSLLLDEVVVHGLLIAVGSHCRASVVVACGLSSSGSVAVVRGLNYSMTCEIFPNQGLNPCSHWQADSYPLCCQEVP